MRVNFEAEELLIGLLVAKPALIDSVYRTISKADFVSPSLGRVFSAMVRLYLGGKPYGQQAIRYCSAQRCWRSTDEMGIDSISVDHLLDLEQSSDDLATHKQAKSLAAAVVRSAQSRQLELLSREFAESLATKSPHEVIEALRGSIAKIERRSTAVAEDFGTYVTRRSASLRKSIKEGRSSCIPIGIEPFDRAMGGMMPGEIMVIAAPTGVGKTAIVMEIALRKGALAEKLLLMSMEMHEEQVADRTVSRELGYSIEQIRSGNITEAHCDKMDALGLRQTSGTAIALNAVGTRFKTFARPFGLSACVKTTT